MRFLMKVELKFTFSIILDLLGITTLLVFWILVIIKVPGLPEEIPTHFNYKGEADSFGSRQSAYLLPGIATVLFVILSIVNRYPEKFNYPFSVNEQNASRHYRLAANFIRVVRLMIVFVFLLIFLVTTTGSSTSLSWLLPLILVITFLPLLIYLFLGSRINNEITSKHISR